MTRISRGPLSLAGAVAILAAACSAPAGASVPPSAAAASRAATAETAAPPLKVGVLLPYTESAVNGDIGGAQKKAADLYLARHGGALGGRPVTLVWSDESVDPALDRTKVRLLLDGKAEVLLGGGGAAAAYALRDAAESAKVVYLDTNATADALTRAVADCEPSCKSRYVFRTSATSWQLSEPLGEWAASHGAARFFAAYEDTAFGTESVAAFAEGLAKNGGRVTGRIAGTDAATLLAAIKAQPSKDVFAALLTDDAAAFLGAWAAQGMPRAGYRLYGPGPLTDQQVLSSAKGAAAGIVTSQIWTPQLDNAETRAIVDGFRAGYTDEETGGPLTPDAYAVEMWDALAALDQALTTTKGDATGDMLRGALENVSIASPRGQLAFDPGHDPVEDVYICEVRASGHAFVNTVVDRRPGVADPGR